MKKLLKTITIVFVLGLVYIVYVNYPRLNIITGFSSKSVVSGVFLANRTQESIEQGDNNFSGINLATNKVDVKLKSVTSLIFGLQSKKAIYVEGLGGILINDNFDMAKKFIIPQRNKVPKNLPYPYGNLPQIDNEFINIDYEVLQSAVDNVFDSEGESLKKTRSVLVF